MESPQTLTTHLAFKNIPKFKNITIMVDLVAPLAVGELAPRAVLAEMLDNYTAIYDSKLKVARHLAELFGAQFGVSVLKMGALAVIRCYFVVANDAYLPQKIDSLNQAIAFLQTDITEPLLDHSTFPAPLIRLHRQNLAAEVATLTDQKRLYAKYRLLQLYYGATTGQAHLITGTPAELAAQTSITVMTAYQQMRQRDASYVSIVGPLTISQQRQLRQQFAFLDHAQPVMHPYAARTITKVVEQTETAKQEQSQLDLAFAFPVQVGDFDYRAALVASMLLGGSSSALLFREVRERASRAYYINSQFQVLQQVLLVESGIDAEHVAEVRQLIEEQVERLKTGNYPEELLQQAQQNLLAERQSGDDSKRVLANRLFLQSLLATKQTTSDFESEIKQVDKAAIAAVSQKLTLQTVYFLRGEGHG
ncbi:putative Zn-dependent peptidase [Fructilactobacillus florum 8D]|uniref:Putative Zn-dependent peptidase n=1 Tax=Fructilactobacillus florum 8D TaxID=1221538 RepID=W9EJP8_9LACO|nr:insulinase family protein [Fructilactobacillus florum]EKK20901.1 putative Zn-dependent peptidase [Fructilactobacillus florum 2F]ETO39884.1 putative Zn-dependent peptidase [Fructilactobacillus florum 8D]